MQELKQVVVGLVPQARPDTSGPEHWGSGMYESAFYALSKLEREERAILAKQEKALVENDTPTFSLCERQLTTQLTQNDDGVTPLRIRIADLKSQIAVFKKTSVCRALKL